MKQLIPFLLFMAVFRTGVTQEIHDLKLDYFTAHVIGEHEYMYTVLPYYGEYHLKFKAKIENTGNQPEEVRLRVDVNNGFSNDIFFSEVVTLEPGESDIFEVDVFWWTNNFESLFVLTALSNNNLENTEDDQANFSITLANMHFPGMAVDHFSAPTSATNGHFAGFEGSHTEQGVGVFYETFVPTTKVSSVFVGIDSVPESMQDTYIGNEVYAKIWGVSDNQLVFLGQSNPRTIAANHFGTGLWLDIPNCVYAPYNLILVAAMFEASQPVPITYSGQTLYQQVVYIGDDELFDQPAIPNTDNNLTLAPIIQPFFVCTAGMDEVQLAFDFTVYPNPAQTTTQIQMEIHKPQDFTLELVDLYGKLIKRIELGHLDAGSQTLQLSLETLETGIYFIHIQSQDKLVGSQKLAVGF